MILITEHNPIIGPFSVTPQQVTAEMLSRPHGEYTPHDIADVIVPRLADLCLLGTVDLGDAAAQMIHETNNLDAALAQREWHKDGFSGPCRNPGGIGVDGTKRKTRPANLKGWVWDADPDRNEWRLCVGFADWYKDSLPALVGRLLAWALPVGAGTDAQRVLIAKALSYRPLASNLRGTAPTIKLLGAAHNPTGIGWAKPGTEYGVQLAAKINAMRAR